MGGRDGKGSLSGGSRKDISLSHKGKTVGWMSWITVICYNSHDLLIDGNDAGYAGGRWKYVYAEMFLSFGFWIECLVLASFFFSSVAGEYLCDGFCMFFLDIGTTLRNG